MINIQQTVNTCLTSFQQLTNILAASGGSSLYEPVTENMTLEAGTNYSLLSDVTVVLPSNVELVIGDKISIIKLKDISPIIEGGSFGITTDDGPTDSITYDVNAELTFIFNGSSWEV